MNTQQTIKNELAKVIGHNEARASRVYEGLSDGRKGLYFRRFADTHIAYLGATVEEAVETIREMQAVVDSEA
jgi:hypothetical protein